MEEVQLNVFVLSDSENVFILDAIRNVGYKRTKEKNDANIIVCLMYCDEMHSDPNWLANTLKSFGQSIKRSLGDNFYPNIPVVFLYTTNTGGNKEHGNIVQGLANLGSELGIASLHIVKHPLNYKSGQEEFERRLAELLPSIFNSRERKQMLPRPAPLVESEGEERGDQPPQPQPSVAKIDKPKRKKVFIHSNLPAEEEKVVLPAQENRDGPACLAESASKARPPTRKEKIVTFVRTEKGKVVTEVHEADIIVVMWRTEPYAGQKNVADFFNEVCQRYRDTTKKVIFAFDYGTLSLEPAQRKEQIARKDAQLEILKKQQLPDNFHLCNEALDFATGEIELQGLLGTAVSPVNRLGVPNVAVAPAPVAPHALFFLPYPEKRERSHSRQFRNTYFEEHLKIKESDDFSIKKKKLVLLFAHYKSLRHSIFNIGHVNSWLSRKIENELAENLMTSEAYETYKKNKDKKRTSNLGKCFDPIANELEKLFLEKYSRTKGDKFLDNLTKLLKYADRRERYSSLFDGQKNQDMIKNIIEAADLAYDHKIRVLVGAEAEKEPNNLPWYVKSVYKDIVRPVEPKRGAVRIK